MLLLLFWQSVQHICVMALGFDDGMGKSWADPQPSTTQVWCLCWMVHSTTLCPHHHLCFVLIASDCKQVFVVQPIVDGDCCDCVL